MSKQKNETRSNNPMKPINHEQNDIYKINNKNFCDSRETNNLVKLQ